MKKLIASILVGGALLAGPAAAQGAHKTDMVTLDGSHVDSLLLRYSFDATWVVDRQTVLVRDTYRDHYLVTLRSPCVWLGDATYKSFNFVPALSGRILAGRDYEVRADGFEKCDIAKVQQVPSNQAAELKAKVAAKG